MPPKLSDPDLLARLVAFDSTSRFSNRPIASFLADYLDRPGLRVEENPSPDGTKVNLVAWAGPPPDGSRRGLILSGHMDTVPAEEEGWESDPFTLTDRGDRYVARGACDMKGFLALAANRLVAAATAPSETALAAPFVLLFTYDEEVGTLGARQLAATYGGAAALPQNAVIGEPTSLQVARVHKGHVKVRIRFTGKSAHSGYPHLGENAIEPAGHAIAALAALRRELEREQPPHCELFPEVPFVPLNVGTVHGGSAINVVPDRAVVELGFRPLPGGDSLEIRRRIEAAVRAAAAPAEPAFELLSDSPPMLLAEEAPLHRTLCEIAGQPAGGSVSFATDAGWLATLGIDCAIFGPGSIEVAHRPNEFIPKSEFERTPGLLDRIVRRYCREEAA